MRSPIMTQCNGGRVTLKIAPEMRVFEVPLNTILYPNSLMKVAEQLYMASRPSWSPLSATDEISIKVFNENGIEIPLHRWAGVVDAGMTAVIHFGSPAAVMDPQRNGLDYHDVSSNIPKSPHEYRSAEYFPSAMSPSPQQVHKALGLERYPSSRLPSPSRPSAIRVQSLPSICEQSATVAVEQIIMPTSITPAPSPQPWKLLLQRAKSREYGKIENDYFCGLPAPAVTSSWDHQSSSDHDLGSSPCDESIQCSNADMDVEMGGTVESETEITVSREAKADHRACEMYRSEILQKNFRLQPPEVSTKRKRGNETESEDSDVDEGCRRAVKRVDFAMANYYRRRLHGLIQAA